MDPKLFPTAASLKRYKDMTTAEVRVCAVCNTEVNNGDRTIRLSAADDDEWVHYWHTEERTDPVRPGA